MNPTDVVVADIALNHLDKFPLAGKPPTVIAFPLQDAPEAFHWAVVNAMDHAGYALNHTGFLKLCLEHPVCVLETPVTVEQRTSVRVDFCGLVKGLVNSRIVVAFTYSGSYNASVIEVQNGTEIKFLDLNAFAPLKLGYISQPLFIRPVGMELAVKKVLCQVLRVLRPSCATMAGVLNSGLDIYGLANAQYSLASSVRL